MGDAVINTSFDLLVDRIVELPAIVCVQKNATKIVPTEDDIMKSNILSFGNAVGGVTNKVTSMFETQAHFEKGTKEYEVLDYRIKCGQLYQQNQIDKSKGIIAKDIPSEWINWVANKIEDDDDDETIRRKTFNRRILTEKKPYFFKYIYSTEMNKYNTYIKNTNEKALMKFCMSFDDLLKKPNKTLEEQKFIDFYYKDMPLGVASCTINRICYRVEDIFKDLEIDDIDEDFDYTIMKNPNIEYDKQLFNKINMLYKKYRKDVWQYMKLSKEERIKTYDRQVTKYLLKDTFQRKCYNICPNKDILCNIVLDICYQSTNKSKEFAWDICGDTIIKNLLERNNYQLEFPKLDPDGDIEFNGQKFSMQAVEIALED